MTPLAKTDKQLKRDQRDRLVAAEYHIFRKAHPGASVSTIVRTIYQGGKFNMSESGIKRVLYRTGAVTANARS